MEGMIRVQAHRKHMKLRIIEYYSRFLLLFSQRIKPFVRTDVLRKFEIRILVLSSIEVILLQRDVLSHWSTTQSLLELW